MKPVSTADSATATAPDTAKGRWEREVLAPALEKAPERSGPFTTISGRAIEQRGHRDDDGDEVEEVEVEPLVRPADVDGLHIRNLMITFFLRFFEPLVRDGHLKILETPLFRVRNKKETLYCYSEKERDEAANKLGRSCEMTRFKGLGEISPGEFKAFIGKEMRLTPVVVDLLP